MKCSECGSALERGWRYCPRCGSRPVRGINFSNIFSRMRKEMDEMSRGVDKSFERNMEAFDISPYFRKQPKSSGFTIKIVSGTGMKPKINVRTFGDVKREDVNKQVSEQLGYKTKQKIPVGHRSEEHKLPVDPGQEKRFPVTKTTEEPATEVRRENSSVVVEMKIPGVKREEDIDIQEREASVEVRAVAGDHGFFKILTKPEKYSLVDKRFDKGKLHLVFA